MTNTSQITKSQGAVSIIAAAILFALFGIGLFVVGFDQGQLFSIVEGQEAYHQVGGMAFFMNLPTT
jgi:hypothetical protein